MIGFLLLGKIVLTWLGVAIGAGHIVAFFEGRRLASEPEHPFGRTKLAGILVLFIGWPLFAVTKVRLIGNALEWWFDVIAEMSLLTRNHAE